VTEGGAVGLKVFAGEERNAATALRMGAVGLVPVCANIDPETCLRIVKAVLEGDDAETDRLQERIRATVEVIVLGGPCWLSGPMYALGRLGLGLGNPVAPLPPAGEEQAARIVEFLAGDR
jgi:dihydrodipicolinate synthase/N-acetylneuraminate lyase